MSDKHEWPVVIHCGEVHDLVINGDGSAYWRHEGDEREASPVSALLIAAQETETLAAKVRELEAENAIMARYVKKFPMSRAEAAESRVAELERIIVKASRYQPMYNGRPSCPFCGNFVDDEETHQDACIVVEIEKREERA